MLNFETYNFQKSVGGDFEDWGSEITIDAVGSAYVTGSTGSPNFPTTSGAFDTDYNSLNGSYYAFVAKLNTTGTALSYATFLGGNGENYGNGIAIDSIGAVYVTGETSSSDFPTTPGAFDTNLNGYADVFVTKLNSNGSIVVYSTFLGGNTSEVSRSIAVDANGAAYVTGWTYSPDFPATPGAFDTILNDGDSYEPDAFVAKLAMQDVPIIAFTGSIVPIYPASHYTISTVMQGGTVFRYFQLLDSGGNPIADAAITFSSGNYATSDVDGYFGFAIPVNEQDGLSSFPVSVQSIIIDGQTYSANSQPMFIIEIKERRYTNTWSYGAIRKASAGIDTGLIAYIGAQTNGGLGLSLEESSPDQTNDDVVKMEQKYSLEETGGIGFGLRFPVDAVLLKSNLNASLTSEVLLRQFGALKTQFSQPYTDFNREVEGTFLAYSVLDSAQATTTQPFVVWMLSLADERIAYPTFITEQSVGFAGKITPIQPNVGIDVRLTAQKGGGSEKGALLGVNLLDVGASRLVKAVLTDYGDEYSKSFGDELSLDLSTLNLELPWISERLIGILGENVRGIVKEYFYDSSTNQLKRVELSLTSEGNSAAFTDVIKKEVIVKITLIGPGLTDLQVEQVGQAQAISDIETLLAAVPLAYYEVTVADGSENSFVPELGIPGTEIKVGLGLEVEQLRSLVRERGVFLNGRPYVTETYEADALVSQPGKSWSELTSNALGGLWLIVEDAFDWISQQISSGSGWIIGIMSKTIDGDIQGQAQITTPPGTQLYLMDSIQQGQTSREITTVTITAISWAPKDPIGVDAFSFRPSPAVATGEGFVVGGIYDFQPHNLTLSQNADLVISYTDNSLGDADESCIGLFKWNVGENNWQPINAEADLEHNTFTASIMQFGTFALGCDITPPQIVILAPTDGSIITNDLPLINASVLDVGAGIDPTTVEMQLDGREVIATFLSGNGALIFLPDTSLALGKHTITLSAKDIVGNDALENFVFTVSNGGPIFADVMSDYWARQFIERLYAAGVTGGCSSAPLKYCPNTPVNRAQMAIFLLRSKYGDAYTPPPATGTVFDDIKVDTWAAAWIEQLAAEGVTGGCGNDNYCPNTLVTREQMAIFLLRAKYGDTYTPPTATGIFTDVPTDYWAATWIEQLAAEGITGGCGGGNYCPLTIVNRAQMAVFLVKTFALP